MPDKIIRDPVHDVIAFRLELPAEALLFQLLNAAEFQRLRRVRQLGMASLAYPTADHSRYSHSIGVLETARKMLRQLHRAFPLDERAEIVCLSAALLHDVGHGPFSHLFERIGQNDHEAMSCRIIRAPTSEIHQLLAAYDSALPEDVASLLCGQGRQTVYRDVLSSQLDADRLDYLLRDNLMTGSRYGDYDLTWLLQALTMDESSGRLAVTWKGISAVEAYLQSRYHMYRNVYFHKVVRSAEGMVKLALQRAGRLAVQDRLPWPPRNHPLFSVLIGQTISIEEFIDLDDVSILHCFKLWTAADDAPLAAICRGLLHRRLYRTLDLSHLDEAGARAAAQNARHAIEQGGGDPAYDLFYDEPADTPYEYAEGGPNEQGEILIRQPDGALRTFASLSPLPLALNRQLMFRRLHVTSAWRDIAARAVGLAN